MIVFHPTQRILPEIMEMMGGKQIAHFILILLMEFITVTKKHIIQS